MLLVLLLAAMRCPLQAQIKKLEFFGAGRFSMTSSQLSGELIKTDTTTPRRQFGGDALFDLGFHIRPTEETEIKAITRVTNDLTGFWGAGITFTLRELFIRGLLLKRIRYQVGDLNTRLTPYTLYNFQGEQTAFMPAALQTYQDIIGYDKFYGQNSWRQQGADFSGAFRFTRGPFDKIGLRGIVAKNRQTDYFSSPDRMYTGAVADINMIKKLHIGLINSRFFDLRGSALFSDTRFVNNVNSASIDYNGRFSRYAYLFSGELALSAQSYEVNDIVTELPDGMAYDAGGELKDTSGRHTLQVRYRSVGTGFRSMGAQTRRIDYRAIPDQLAYFTNSEIPRPVGLQDLLLDGNVYNMIIRPFLMDYNPAYDNFRPYGKATPNRQGVDLNYVFGSNGKFIDRIHIDAAYAKEITGQGTKELRSFIQAGTGLSLNIHSLVKVKTPIRLSAYGQLQQTNRNGAEGVEKVDLSGMYIRSGIEWEMIPGFEWQVALITSNVKGDEFLPVRDDHTLVNGFTKAKFDLNEQFLLGGICYSFTPTIKLLVQYQQISRKDNLTPSTAYSLGQLRILYNMFF